MNQIDETFEPTQNSCKTYHVESTMADTNSRSFNSIISRNTFTHEFRTEFQISTESRAPKPEEEEPVSKKKASVIPIPLDSNVADEPSKKQEVKVLQKSLQKIIEERKREVKKILQAPSLRDKFSHLLPGDMKLKIGYLHHKLINKMACIDRCIIIINKNTEKRSLAVKEVQSNVRPMKENIEDNDLRQMIFLNENFGRVYHFEWVQKPGTEEYQLSMRIPSHATYNERSRKCEFRRVIHKFLLSKYAEHLTSQGIITQSSDLSSLQKWDHSFNVDDVRIPMGHFPQHPLQRKLSISSMKQEDINQISNKNLKQIIEDTISAKKIRDEKYQECQFPKSHNFKNKLYSIIRSKEELYEDEKKLRMVKEIPPEKKLLIKFCEQSCALFIERRVSTMFRINFLDLMKKRMEILGPIGEVEDILNQVLGVNVGFLSKIQSQRGVMIQITKENYNDAIRKIEAQ